MEKVIKETYIERATSKQGATSPSLSITNGKELLPETNEARKNRSFLQENSEAQYSCCQSKRRGNLRAAWSRTYWRDQTCKNQDF